MADLLASILAQDSPAFRPCPTVQLLHTLPDGGSHVDWMIGCESGGALVTFRLNRPLRDLELNRLETAVRLADHRREYLDYEGPISSDRGRVVRLDRGTIDEIEALAEQADRSWLLAMSWESGVRNCLRLIEPPIDGPDGNWRVEKLSIESICEYQSQRTVACGGRKPIASKER